MADINKIVDGNGNAYNFRDSEAARNTPTFSQASSRANLNGSGETMPTILGKIKKWFADLKALAFKEKVADSDIDGTISDSHIASASTWNGKLNADGSNGTDATAGNLIRKLTTWTQIDANNEYVPAANNSAGATSPQGRYSFATILSWIKDNISPLAKTLKINAPSGGSAYFEIERTDSSQSDTGFRVRRTALGSNDIEFAIGAGGENRGFYDNNGIGGWAVWLDSSDNLNLMPNDSNASSGRLTIQKGDSSTHDPLIYYRMNHENDSNDPRLGVFASINRFYGVQLDADRKNKKYGVYAFPTNSSSSGKWACYVDSDNMASLGGDSDTSVRLGNTVITPSAIVLNTRKVNGHALSGDVSVTKGDVGLGNIHSLSQFSIDSLTVSANSTSQSVLDIAISGSIYNSTFFVIYNNDNGDKRPLIVSISCRYSDGTFNNKPKMAILYSTSYNSAASLPELRYRDSGHILLDLAKTRTQNCNVTVLSCSNNPSNLSIGQVARTDSLWTGASAATGTEGCLFTEYVGSATGSVSKPVYFNAAGFVKECTSVDADTVDGWHISVGTLSTHTDTISFL